MAIPSTFKALRLNERKQRTRLIVDAAASLLATQNIHEIGMRVIAKKVGITAAAIYRYFQCRDDLFIEVLALEMVKVEILLEARLENGIQSIDEVAVAVIDHLMDHETAYQIMCYFLILGPKNSKSFDKYNDIARNFLNMFESVLKRAGIAGKLPLFPYALFSSLAGVVMTFRHYPNFSDAQKKQMMHKMALAMLKESINPTG